MPPVAQLPASSSLQNGPPPVQSDLASVIGGDDEVIDAILGDHLRQVAAQAVIDPASQELRDNMSAHLQAASAQVATTQAQAHSAIAATQSQAQHMITATQSAASAMIELSQQSAAQEIQQAQASTYLHEAQARATIAHLETDAANTIASLRTTLETAQSRAQLDRTDLLRTLAEAETYIIQRDQQFREEIRLGSEQYYTLRSQGQGTLGGC